MNILVALDKNYLGPLNVMLKSLFKSNPNSEFDIYVAHSSLTKDDLLEIKRATDPSRSKVISVKLDNSLFDGAPFKERLSIETYYRLFACKFLPKDMERILYIDPDTYILNPIDDFYNVSLNSCVYCGAGHMNDFVTRINRLRLGMPKGSTYVNAGVLLINLEKMRERFSSKEIFDYIKKKDMQHVLYQADQDVINGLYANETMYLDENIINLDERCFTRLAKKMGVNEALEYVQNNTMILHYAGKDKPWKENYKGLLNKFYV